MVDDRNKAVLHDARQLYYKLLVSCMGDVIDHRQNGDFIRWLDSLDNIYDLVYPRLNSDERAELEGRLDDLFKQVDEISTKNSTMPNDHPLFKRMANREVRELHKELRALYRREMELMDHYGMLLPIEVISGDSETAWDTYWEGGAEE